LLESVDDVDIGMTDAEVQARKDAGLDVACFYDLTTGIAFSDAPGDETPPPKRRRSRRNVPAVYDVQVRIVRDQDERSFLEWQLVGTTRLSRVVDFQEMVVFLERHADYQGVQLRVAREPFVPDTQLVIDALLPSGSVVQLSLGH